MNWDRSSPDCVRETAVEVRESHVQGQARASSCLARVLLWVFVSEGCSSPPHIFLCRRWRMEQGRQGLGPGEYAGTMAEGVLGGARRGEAEAYDLIHP